VRSDALLAAMAFLVIAGAPPNAGAQAPGDRAAEETFAAQQLFDAGRAALEAGDHATALESLEASLALSPSPNTRLMLARALRESGRVAEALMEFDRAAHAAEERMRAEPRFSVTRETAITERDAIRERVATVVISGDLEVSGIEVRIGDRALPIAGARVGIPVDPGTVVLRASAPGHLDFQHELELRAGETVHAVVTMQRAPAEPRGERDAPAPATESALALATATATVTGASDPVQGLEVVAWTSSAIIAISVGAGIALLVAAQSRFDALSSLCGDRPCAPALAGAVEEGRRFEGGLWAMVATTGVATVAALIAFLSIADRDLPEATAARDGALLRW
jgi:hypothetical protein